MSEDQIRTYVAGDEPGEGVEFADMPWSKQVYIGVHDPENFTNVIIKRKDLEKFMKASKPKKKTTQEKLKALKIGTRFTTESDHEFIKVGKDAYVETNEKLAKEAFKNGLGFAPGEVFAGKITVVED